MTTAPTGFEPVTLKLTASCTAVVLQGIVNLSVAVSTDENTLIEFGFNSIPTPQSYFIPIRLLCQGVEVMEL